MICKVCSKHAYHNYDLQTLLDYEKKIICAYHVFAYVSLSETLEEIKTRIKCMFAHYNTLNYFCTHVDHEKTPHCHFIITAPMQNNIDISELSNNNCDTMFFKAIEIKSLVHLINTMGYIGNKRAQSSGTHTNISIPTNNCSVYKDLLYRYVTYITYNIKFSNVKYLNHNMLPELMNGKNHISNYTIASKVKYLSSYRKHRKWLMYISNKMIK